MPAVKLLLVSLQSALLAALLSCSSGDGDGSDSAPPVLTVPPISLAGPYNAATQTFGEVSFHPPGREWRALIPFGVAALPGGALTPGFEYYTTPDAIVRASCGGEIVNIFKNEGVDDWEILIKAAPHATWAVQHDHVSNPLVKLGDKVRAGDILGGTGKWSASLGRTELAVVSAEGPGLDLCHCPMKFGTAEFVQRHDELLATMKALGFGPYGSLCLADVVKP